MPFGQSSACAKANQHQQLQTCLYADHAYVRVMVVPKEVRPSYHCWPPLCRQNPYGGHPHRCRCHPRPSDPHDHEETLARYVAARLLHFEEKRSSPPQEQPRRGLSLVGLQPGLLVRRQVVTVRLELQLQRPCLHRRCWCCASAEVGQLHPVERTADAASARSRMGNASEPLRFQLERHRRDSRSLRWHHTIPAGVSNPTGPLKQPHAVLCSHSHSLRSCPPEHPEEPSQSTHSRSGMQREVASTPPRPAYPPQHDAATGRARSASHRLHMRSVMPHGPWGQSHQAAHRPLRRAIERKSCHPVQPEKYWWSAVDPSRARCAAVRSTRTLVSLAATHQ
mmetsp:Transcript_144628/g.277621  ORF Transcript_144628/g.277621 Transcript_144628/m.277621 type:complete len:337 (+) Transcript_144628:134-1144(+)